MRTTSAILLIAAAAAWPALAHGQPPAAKSGRVQAEVQLMGAFPTGVYKSGINADELIDNGLGFTLGATYGLGGPWAIGIRGGHHHNERQVEAQFIGPVPGPPIVGAGPAHIVAQGDPPPGTILRQLDSTPLHLMGEYAHAWRPGFKTFAEGGIGLTAFTQHTIAHPANNAPISTTGYQRAFSFLVGGGAAYGITRSLEITGSADYQQSVTSDGDVWAKGDNPKFFTVMLGVRFPRR
jgi:opacity protein-like surface antigen